VKVALVHLDATDQCERVFDAIRATADPEEDIADIVAGGGDDGRALVKPALDPRAGVLASLSIRTNWSVSAATKCISNGRLLCCCA